MSHFRTTNDADRHRKVALPAALFVAVVAIIALGYASLPSSPLHSAASASATRTVVSIGKGAAVEPSGFNVTQLLTGAFHYRYNFTVVIGVNNTVTWLNNDAVAHTVSSFVVPDGAKSFNSDLILPQGTFTVTLTVPGVYKYTCIWHPWLAGQITVKS
jgi:plastocyanin